MKEAGFISEIKLTAFYAHIRKSMRFLYERRGYVETKLAHIGIIVEDICGAEPVNDLLHEYSEYMVGRMGIPYREKGVNVISIVLDAPDNVISALCGKLGMVKGINVKSMIAKTGKDKK